MTSLTLITGGAGFIGQHLARQLLTAGRRVRILDNFSPQVHATAELPADLAAHVELVRGDVRHRDDLRRALQGVDCLVHLAAETGTGQSMYEIGHYFDVNVQATATLLDLLQNDDSGRDVDTLVVASSRAVYGEGAYLCGQHGLVYPEPRTAASMARRQFQPTCPACGQALELAPTPEDAPFRPMSFYGLTKQIQEQAVLLAARTRGLTAYGLRYQNVYGPGQSLKNPYTGILAVFSNLARTGETLQIFEDGHESRDFVFIDDVVAATMACVTRGGAYVGALNVGTGAGTSVLDVASRINAYFGDRSALGVTGAFRLGDIRHNVADTRRAAEVLGFTARVPFATGIERFLVWAMEFAPENAISYQRSMDELKARGLFKEG